ncbi:MAG: prepilin-type N-terminal cleavage/methylation domain-containing protein [Acidobacteria bacterium]|nr:prepilin-type N-terminal cleavage/methylation domain-containing protein [Acidobacteriota bacterium]
MSRLRERGYSLLEVLVALALLSMLFIIAGQLLVASRRMEASAARVSAGPRLGTLGVQLRRDVESAVAVPGGGGAWSSLPLPLALKDGTTVRYDFDGRELSRSVVQPGGLSRRRVVVRGLRSFRWRPVAGRAVEVKVGFAEPVLGDASRIRARDSVWWLRTAPRGAGWERRW